MKWYFLNTGFNTGKYNMDFDLSLVNNCKDDEAFFRLYRWKPYCISLGANQSFDSVEIIKVSNDNIDVVKRPTGGRAILHAEELTYSVVYPLKNISSLRSFYCEVNKALKEGLIFYDNRLSSLTLESIEPDLRKLYKEPLSEICFAVSAKNEIKFDGKKLVGSAQRKINNTILQHGSILCGEYHKKITEYLYPAKQEVLNNEMSERTIELENIFNHKTDYERLAESLCKGFEKYFNIKFEKLNPENSIIQL